MSQPTASKKSTHRIIIEKYTTTQFTKLKNPSEMAHTQPLLQAAACIAQINTTNKHSKQPTDEAIQQIMSEHQTQTHQSIKTHAKHLTKLIKQKQAKELIHKTDQYEIQAEKAINNANLNAINNKLNNIIQHSDSSKDILKEIRNDIQQTNQALEALQEGLSRMEECYRTQP